MLHSGISRVHLTLRLRHERHAMLDTDPAVTRFGLFDSMLQRPGMRWPVDAE